MTPAIRLAGDTWAHAFGPVSEVEWSETWERGCEQASWTTRPGGRHPHQRVGVRAEVHRGAGPTWVGRIAEVGRDGKIVATGLWRQGETVKAVDSAGKPTFHPDVAVDAASAAKSVWWRRVGSLGAAYTPEDATKPMSLTALLDACMGDTGDVWRVDGRGYIYREARPTAPRWHVAPGLWSLTPADDGFVTAVRVTYLAAIGDIRTETAFYPRDVDTFGWREGETIDLIGEGVITAEAAKAKAKAALDALGPRIAFTESLTLRPGELTTIGGTPGGLSSLRPGHVARVAGAWDASRPGAPKAYTDAVIGRAQHSGDAVTISAQGQPARTLADVIGALTP